MAKGAWIGVNSVAHKVKNMYVGVNGVAHKVKKAWIGVNGVARLIFDAVGGAVGKAVALFNLGNNSSAYVIESPYTAYRDAGNMPAGVSRDAKIYYDREIGKWVSIQISTSGLKVTRTIYMGNECPNTLVSQTVDDFTDSAYSISNIFVAGYIFGYPAYHYYAYLRGSYNISCFEGIKQNGDSTILAAIDNDTPGSKFFTTAGMWYDLKNHYLYSAQVANNDSADRVEIMRFTKGNIYAPTQIAAVRISTLPRPSNGSGTSSRWDGATGYWSNTYTDSGRVNEIAIIDGWVYLNGGFEYEYEESWPDGDESGTSYDSFSVRFNGENNWYECEKKSPISNYYIRPDGKAGGRSGYREMYHNNGGVWTVVNASASSAIGILVACEEGLMGSDYNSGRNVIKVYDQNTLAEKSSVTIPFVPSGAYRSGYVYRNEIGTYYPED